MRKFFAVLTAVAMMGFAATTSQAAAMRTNTNVRSLAETTRGIPLTSDAMLAEGRGEVQLARHYAPRHFHHHHYAPRVYHGHRHGAYYRGYGYPRGHRGYGYGGGYYAPPCYSPYSGSGFSLYLGF